MRNLDEIHRLLRWYIKTYPYHQFIEWSWLLVVLILLDRFTKIWFTTQLNKWSSFGISWLGTQALIVLGVGITGILIWLVLQKKVPVMPTMLVLAWVIGNTVDRIFYEGVRDWIDWGFFIGNLADVWLTVGALRLVWWFVAGKEKQKG